ncbi:potassium channel family protein [uncultured Fibrobacter sp.]|uniref:potassium channel family protein n=1 Tax=uncultured Fibrobacter sp. TaxID=261512 RepID=UPI0025E0727E|nr:potassium channel family protein [uncultured Fibrobacter sp.]
MDSFIINDREGSKILEYIIGEDDEPILSLSYKRERLENVIKREILINKKISDTSAKASNIEDSLLLFIKNFQESKMLAYKEDSASRFETYNRQIDSLNRIKSFITFHLDSVQKNMIDVYLSRIDVNIADIRLKKSSEDLILIKKYVEGNIYYNEELELKINSTQDSLNTIRRNLDILRIDSLSSVREEYGSAKHDLQKTLFKIISPFDFLFYSLGIATTTTFGDFTPNNIVIKLLTSLELIIGIFLIACLVGKLQKRRSSKQE